MTDKTPMYLDRSEPGGKFLGPDGESYVDANGKVLGKASKDDRVDVNAADPEVVSAEIASAQLRQSEADAEIARLKEQLEAAQVELKAAKQAESNADGELLVRGAGEPIVEETADAKAKGRK